MSPDVAAFLRDMLLRQQIPVADPNLLAVAALAAKALDELNGALAQPDPDGR